VKRGNEHEDERTVKCLIWDLDNTLWDGVLLEDQHVSLRDGVGYVLEELDRRGILHSIASRCDHGRATDKLRELGLDQYFLYPQINWGSKVPSVKAIAQLLNIGLDAIAFVDDQPSERDEVRFSLPGVLCFDAAIIHQLTDLPEFSPRSVTEHSRMRRLMYTRDMVRQRAREDFEGTDEAFLASLGIVLTVFPAKQENLQRAEELTLRTNQLNSTGYTYSYDQLLVLSRSDEHSLLMASLEDKYGSYGSIGLVLLQCDPRRWTIKLLLTSCRVVSRGVGSVLLSQVMRMAKRSSVLLCAEFIDNGRNRLMNITFRLAGFREVERSGAVVTLAHSLEDIPSIPGWFEMRVCE
jgi:FkbH-like protein